MKEYLVTMDGAQWNNIFIVLALNAKDAINQVFEEYFAPENIILRKENKEYGEPLNYIYAKSDFCGRIYDRDR